MIMTPWQEHVERWEGCLACDLCKGRKRMCHARGQIPCDALLVGEAPGESEDVLGQPFVGPAGKLLDCIVENAWGGKLRVAFANLVACFPREEKRNGDRQPPDLSVMACAPRLEELAALADPKLLVCVGSLAARWLMAGRGSAGGKRLLPDFGSMMTSITHPAAILRANVSQKGLMIQRCEAVLRQAAEELDLV